MSRKHIDIDEPTPTPAFIMTVLTGTLDMRIGGAKPQVRLVQTSSGYEVVFEAHGETRGRWFEHLGQAQRYFERLTGRTSSFEYTSRREIVRRAAGTVLGVAAAALIGCVASGSAFAACLTYSSPIHITGTLTRQVFPGLPHYESIARGDTPEIYYVLKLNPPACVDKDPTDSELPRVDNLTAIQLVLTHDQYLQMERMVGRRVGLSGDLFPAETGHHHTPVLMDKVALGR